MSEPNDSDDRIAALAAELGRLGSRLGDMGAELAALRTGGVAAASSTPDSPSATDAAAVASSAAIPGVSPLGHAPPPAQPDPRRAYSAQPGAGYPGHPGSWQPGAVAYPAQQYPGQYPPQYPTRYPAPHPPAAPSGPRPPRTWLTSLSGARLLAWTGGAVTLLGVVLLLALAASRGWFSPVGRVIAGAALGVALLGLAPRLHRRESTRTGALALAGTGIATLYLVVAAATALYAFLPAPVGLLLAVLVAGGGLGLADRWRSQLLAAGAVAGAALLAPAVTDGLVPLLVALVLALQLAAAPVVLRRRWPWLAGVAAAGPMLFGALTAALSTPGGERTVTVAAIVAVLVIGVAVAVLAARSLRAGTAVGLLVAAPVPALVMSAVLGGWGGAGLAAGAAVLLLAVAAWTQLDRALRIAALAAGSVALFEATVVALDGAAENAVLLGEALVLVVVAAVLRSRVPLIVGSTFGLIGVLGALGRQVPPRALAAFPAEPFVADGRAQTTALVAGAGMAALVLAFAVAVLIAVARVGVLRADPGSARIWVPAGAVALYGGAGLVVCLTLLASPDRTGFVAGHAVVTVSWTVVALVLLARGISRPALRITGLVLVAAAVAKLILFDLVALDGIARVVAFLGAGLVLLAAGTRYARLVAEAEEKEERG